MGFCGGALIILLPRGPGAIAALILWTAATLAAGERGFARWFPKLPLFGSLLAASTILVRWYSLMSLSSSDRRVLASSAIALAAAQAATVAFGWTSHPADEPAVQRLSRITTTRAVVAVLQGLVALALIGAQIGAVIGIVLYLLIRLIGGLARWRFGGARGLDLEAYRVLAETAALMIMASYPAGR